MDYSLTATSDVNLYNFLVNQNEGNQNYMFFICIIVMTECSYACSPIHLNWILVSFEILLALPRWLLSGKPLLSELWFCLQASLHVQE